MGEPNRRAPQVKEAIITLCRIFKYSGICENVAPDDIRLAKFDKPEAVSTLLKLLQKLLKLPDPLDRLELCSKMKSLRYPRSSYTISPDGSIKSSRELLLAISWFLHTTRFIDRKRHQACQPLDIARLWKKQTQSETSSIEQVDTLSLNERVSRLTWSVSQLSLWKKQYISTKVGIEVAKVKLTKDISPDFKDDPLLLLVLKTPSFSNKYEKALEKKIYLLHACIQWSKLQSIFWLWMDSVLANAPDTDNCSSITQSEESTAGLKAELQKKILFLEKQICDQRMLYPRSKVDLSLISLSPEMKLTFTKEMKELRTRLVDPCHCPRLRQAGPGATNYCESSVCMNAEIDRLAELNHQQTQKIQEFRYKTRKKLEDFSTNFSGVVLVPPSQVKRARPILK